MSDDGSQNRQHGWFAIKRGALNHELLRPKGKFSKFEAWVWMIEAAKISEKVIDIGGAPVTVPRGSFVHSFRFMAGAWRWSLKAVQNFVRDLEAHETIRKDVIRVGHKKDTQRIRITICNYDKYQLGGYAEDTQRIRSGYKQEQDNNNSVKGEVSDAPPGDQSHPVDQDILNSAIWGAGKPYLISKGVKNPGPIIGKWLKTYPPIKVMEALSKAQRSSTDEPVAFITGCLRRDGRDQADVSSKVQRIVQAGKR